MTREEAINRLRDMIIEIRAYCDESKHMGEDDRQDIETFNIAIKALEQEPRKGHWIMTNDYLTTAYGSVDYVKCSCCGEDSLEEGNYCPNCGADMRGEK